MNDIAQASARGRRTLYTYFRSKEEVYFAVIREELDGLSEQLDAAVGTDAPPEEKIFRLIYAHLGIIRDVVARNGSLRAEFFRNIWHVEKIRRSFDEKEHKILQQLLQEGVDQGRFRIDSVPLMADIIHYSVKGLEVPYIYDRLGPGLDEGDTYPIVMGIVRRVLNMPADENATTEGQ